MTYSQLEIVSSPRFGSVLRDRNRRDVFEKNLKVLVKDRLRNRSSFESDAPSDENSQNRRIDSWIENTQQPNKTNRCLRATRSLRFMKEDFSSNDAKQTPCVVDNNPKESVSSSSPRRSNSTKREKLENFNSGRSENLKRNENLGASSLVQIWEARLNRSNGGNSANQSQSTVTSSRSSSGISTIEISCSGLSVDGECSRESESADESDESASKSDQSVQIQLTISSNGKGSVSDSGDSKWVRVADIIRRLSNDQKQSNNKDGMNELACIRAPRPYSSSTSSSDLTARSKSFQHVTCSPRLRGRQAFSDLLMQMERDRHLELDSLLQQHAVSKFSQRGRLQSMLRLRSLQRCVAIQDRHRSKAIAAGPNQLSSGSAVLNLRDKFRTSARNSATGWTDAALRKTQSFSVAAQLNEDSTEQPSMFKVDEETFHKALKAAASADESDKNCLRSQETIVLCNKGESERRNKEKTASDVKQGIQDPPNANDLQETGEETPFDDSSKENDRQREEKNVNSQQYPLLESQRTSETLSPLPDSCKSQKVEEDHDTNNQQDQYLESHEMTFMNCWEENQTEEEYNDQQYYYGETSYDWLSEISRPRSYWEDLRKDRYLEVLSTRSENEEIRQLLERRTVSDFLESDMRERLDTLMMSRAQRQFGRESNREEYLNEHGQESINQWALTEEEDDDKDEVEEEQEQGEKTEEQEGETSNLSSDDSSQSSQMFSPSPGRSWSSRDQEITSTPLLPMNNPSAEMELVNVLRGQIELLQREMLELRKSVKSCMDMNLELQQSVNRDNLLKRKCCICNETQVESLLYRCGHICTCLKCAHELQWNRGKCPICRAPIRDVVRVFIDSRDHTTESS